MNILTVYSNTEFGDVRTIEVDGEPMFCLTDICKALGLSQPSKVKERLNEKGVNTIPTLTAGGSQNLLYINESNLYKTIFQSRKESAERFTEWVTSEVLPSIRKTGAYRTNKDGYSLKEQVESLQAAADMLHMNDASKLLMLEGFYKGYNIPTDFLPKYENNGSREMKSATELLKRFECGISAGKFNLMLLEHGYLEERERASSKGNGIKKFKALTESGLKYGENLVSPHNQREVQPYYYVDSFMELYNKVA